ncbi:hypothetical protein LPJ72_004453 [Coemansia sp. Benny D160-2]|nr:hypothetical protein LPJ72_004453 [Coemansia sp. Benny D160-2]
MGAEQKDATNKQSRRRAVTSTIKRSLKGEWQALSTSSSPRTSLNLDQEAPGESSSASELLSPIHLHADVERQRSVWSRRSKKKKEAAMVRSLADLLVAAQPSSAVGISGTDSTEVNGSKHNKDRSSASWALTWSGGRRRLGGSRRNLSKMGVGGSSDDDDDDDDGKGEGGEHSRPMHRRRRGLSNTMERAEYPQSDDPASGQSARERKLQIDAVYDQTVQMARDLDTSLNITRMEAAGFLSLARWDVDAALRQLHIVLCTHDGVLYNIDPRIQMCGAANSGGTSCYIDSLLMALFGAQSSFDALLYVRDLGSESANKLLAITRLYVNFMRAGELIDVWLVEEMRSALLACGWLGGAFQAETMGSAQKQQQQDTSELYLFLMDVLQMPYLPLEMRMVHGADHDTADCKMVTQRMVELSFPEEDSRNANENSNGNSENGNGKDSTNTSNTEHPLLLQALLESYFFDNRVEQLERSLKSSSESGKPTSTKVRTNAWSFLSMYPFYTPQSEFDIHGPRSTAAAEYPDDAPFILPLLIKRYAVDERGRVHRVKRRVIIPMVLDVTNIISEGDDTRCVDEKTGSVGGTGGGQPARVSRAQTAGSEQQTPLPPPYPSRIQYRLVLRSAVCHKGANVRSGHYISFSTRLRMARPAEIARRRLRSTRETTEQHHHASDTHAQPGDGVGTLPSASQQQTMSFSNISGGGIMRWRTFAHAASSASRESSTNAPVTGAEVEAGGYHSMQKADEALKQRRHSWPLSGSKESIEKHLDSILYGAVSKSSTPPASLCGSQIHGSAADWEKYAMTIDLDEQQQEQEHREDEWLRNMAATANTSKEALHEEYQNRHRQPPPPYPLEEDADAGALETQRLCHDSAAECASTTGELLRFDDMDIAHGRVQNFSTGEGGRRCLDEISRDGYLLFYALQRVEMQASEQENKDEKEQEEEEEKEGRVGMGGYSGHIPEESPSQAMDELSSALRRNERDEQARRIITALLHNSGAVESQRSVRHSDFERMAMRWQNIRLDKQMSPVGPLLGSRSRWPQHHQQSQKLQESQKAQLVDELDSDSSRAVLHPACQTSLETSVGGLSLDGGPADGVERPLLSSRSSESGQRGDDAVRQHKRQHRKKKGAAAVGVAAADSAEARDETKAVRGRHSGTTSDRWCKIM